MWTKNSNLHGIKHEFKIKIYLSENFFFWTHQQLLSKIRVDTILFNNLILLQKLYFEMLDVQLK